MTPIDKPSWDTYFFAMAYIAASRSLDPHTKHGCVLVDKHNRHQSTGYNGPVACINDEIIPLTRPEKYDWLIHAELNAILNYHGDLTGSTAYVTGLPCEKCISYLAQKGIKTVKYGNVTSKCVDTEKQTIVFTIAKQKNIALIDGSGILQEVKQLLSVIGEKI